MEVFSLEEDDGNELFITQESKIDRINRESNDKGIIGDPEDFSTPCVSLVSQGKHDTPAYSDISDSEDFQIPSSQIDYSSVR